MSLLQKRQRSQGDGGGGALAKQSTPGGALARPSEYRRQIDRAFDRLMREFDRDPIRALSTLPRRLESLTGNLAAWPAIDVAEDDKAVTLRVDVPGLDPKDVDVEVSGNVLTIQGKRQDEWSENERGVRRRERISGSFARTITLPTYVDAAKAEASYQNGTLTITIPKIEGKGPKRVPVTT
jgi:HSP20 family protein